MDKQINNTANNLESFSTDFLENGFIVKSVINNFNLYKIRQKLVEISCDILEVNYPKNEEVFLNSFHKFIDSDKINDLRLHIYNNFNSISWLKLIYYSIAEDFIKSLVGNELVIQKRINLSIQLPNDDSSLLPVHADVWNGDSPFELVMWLPMVDCYNSKSMFILPLEEEKKISKQIDSFKTESSDELFNIIKGNLRWINIKFGEVLLFSQNLMHGNIVNTENQTRWSMNCRFKSLFSPYCAKKLGDFFEPLSINPVTKLGMNYKFPKGFEN